MVARVLSAPQVCSLASSAVMCKCPSLTLTLLTLLTPPLSLLLQQTPAARLPCPWLREFLSPRSL